MEQQVKAGDVVELKSGGPKMTVKWVNETSAYCEWFAGTKIEGATFTSTSLTIPVPPTAARAR